MLSACIPDLLHAGARGPLHPAQGTQTAAPVPDTPVRGQAPGTTPGGTASGNPLKGAREAESTAAAPPQVPQQETRLVLSAHLLEGLPGPLHACHSHAGSNACLAQAQLHVHKPPQGPGGPAQAAGPAAAAGVSPQESAGRWAPACKLSILAWQSLPCKGQLQDLLSRSKAQA